MMYTYIFSGKIYPKEANFSLGSELFFVIKHEKFDVDGEISLKFLIQSLSAH